MVKFTLEVGGTAACPMRDVVAKMVDEKSGACKIVFGPKLRGRYQAYVDDRDPRNLFGFVLNASQNGKEVNEDNLESLLQGLKNVRITGRTAYKFFLEGESKSANLMQTGISEELDAIIQDKVRQGIATEEEILERAKVMVANNVPTRLMEKVIGGYRAYTKPVHVPRCIYNDPFLQKGKEGVVAEGLRMGAMRMATICEGEKSVGKNVYMETIAWLMGMPLYMMAFSRQMNPASVFGEKTTDNSASEALAGMKSQAKAKVFLSSGSVDRQDPAYRAALDSAAEFELTKARAASVSVVLEESELYSWMTDGGVMVLNEMNMGESNFLSSFLNPLTDGTGFLTFPGRGEVKMHPDCVLFGTQNADYEGCQMQNEATLSRFNVLQFQQPESVKELLKSATEAAVEKSGIEYKLPDKYYDAADAFYRQALASVRTGSTSNTVLNIRGFVRALSIVAETEGSGSLARWLEISVLNACPVEEREALRAVLKSVVQL